MEADCKFSRVDHSFGDFVLLSDCWDENKRKQLKKRQNSVAYSNQWKQFRLLDKFTEF